MTEIVLVRHGETVWHAENRYAGRSDVELTDRGRRQADRLAVWAAGAGLDGVLASPLRRAVETAVPAAAAAGRALRTDDRLVEVDFGHGEGLTRDEMHARFPDALARYLAAPATCALPGGETGRDAVARARPALAEQARAGAGRVLVVGHQTLWRLLLCRALGIPLDRYRQVLPRLDNAALTRLRIDPERPDRVALLALNVPTGDDPAS